MILMREMIEFENRKKMKKEYEETNKTLKFALNIFQNDKEFWKTIISKLIKENNFVTALELI